MQQEEKNKVDGFLVLSSIIYWVIGIAIIVLVLTFGPLLSVWMFINSMQLIAHVPLIRSKLPGNAHYFLLEHLNIIRLHFFGLNSWLNRSKLDDSSMVTNEDADHYTTLVY